MKKKLFTEEQLEELKQMMEDGVRQTDIAEHFNMTADTLRKRCREAGLEIRMPHKRVCAICGETFYTNIPKAKTCKKEHHRICKVCGKDFIVDRDDIRDTCPGDCTAIDRYGTTNVHNRPEVAAKRKATMLKKYGVEYYTQLPEVVERRKKANLEKYGVEWYTQTEEYQKKKKATNLERYGCEEPLADPEYRAKLFARNKEIYGEEHPMRTAEIKAKHRATLMEKYGVDNVMKVPEIVERLKKNNYLKYGVTSHAQRPEIKAKTSQTCQDRFGVPWACMRKEARCAGNNSGPNRQFKEWLSSKNISWDDEFVLDSFSYDIKCGDVLIEIDPTATHNNYIGIHNTPPVAADYHLTKTNVAKKYSYQCIHLFDWEDGYKIAEMLLFPTQPIYARSCEIKEIDEETAIQFTVANHIQGSCRGQKQNVGLFYKNELVEVMTFGKPRYNKSYDLELLRLCTKHGYRVVGGASKLFKYFTNNHSGLSIISYCDNSKFTGLVYEKIGMQFEYLSDPNKIWSKNKMYVTDNLLRQRGYDQLFGTSYGKGTSNEQLMLDNGWLPVYDCGQLVFSYNK